MYTNDATFGVSSTWGTGVKVWFRGRDQLARAGGAGPNGICRPPLPNPEYHLYPNHVITPTPTGAVGVVDMLMIGLGGDPNKIQYDGYYDDVYVKTPAGWRFKSRVHVWPEMKWTDRPEDMPPRKIEEE
jgi:hypothetical protein